MSKNNKKNTKKNLTVSQITKNSKLLDEQYETSVWVKTKDDMEEMFFKVDKHFKETKIDKFLADLLVFIQTMSEEDPEKVHEMFTPYSMTLMIKIFTNIKIPDDIETQMEITNRLYDLEILEEIVAEFPQSQITKIYAKMAEMLERIDKNIQQSEREVELMGLEKELEEMRNQLDSE